MRYSNQILFNITVNGTDSWEYRFLRQPSLMEPAQTPSDNSPFFGLFFFFCDRNGQAFLVVVQTRVVVPPQNPSFRIPSYADYFHDTTTLDSRSCSLRSLLASQTDGHLPGLSLDWSTAIRFHNYYYCCCCCYCC